MEHRTGFLGTGILGRPTAARLAQEGVALVAWNRTRAKAAPLGALHVEIAETPEAVLAACGTVLVMLSDAAAIEAVLFARPATVEALAGRTIIQMGTISPQQSHRFADRVHAAGGVYLEAPVLGSVEQAESGELLVLVGGTRGAFEAHNELLKHLGPVRHLGPVGHAATIKLALNQLIGSLTAAFAASFGLVRRAGVDRAAFLTVLRASALWAGTFDKKLPRIEKRDYSRPNFPLRHLLKDIDLFLAVADDVGVRPDVVQAIRALCAEAVEAGHADDDYAALYSAIDPA